MIITNAWIRTLVHDNDLEVYVIMKFFIDTANVDYIKEANDMGRICGNTTDNSHIICLADFLYICGINKKFHNLILLFL